jgi:hypothetical protein
MYRSKQRIPFPATALDLSLSICWILVYQLSSDDYIASLTTVGITLLAYLAMQLLM